MSVLVQVLPDGSVAVTDNGRSFPPLSPEAVTAISAQAAASANAHQSQELAEGLATLAQLITAAAPIAGADAYAQVTVIPGRATAVVDAASFELVQHSMPGKGDGNGGWVAGPVVVTRKPEPPSPTTAA